MIRDTFDLFEDSASPRGRFGDGDNRVRKSHLIDLALALHHETERAVRISNDGEDTGAVWLPKSLCEIERQGKTLRGHDRNGQAVTLPLVTMTLEESLARDKGLI